MPLLSLQTNLTIETAQKQTLLTTLSQMTAKILSKPESYVMISIQSETSMIFAGSEDPLAYVELKSLGLPEDQTGEISTTICQTIKQQLDIDPARVYIEFNSGERHMWGWNNKTFG